MKEAEVTFAELAKRLKKTASRTKRKPGSRWNWNGAPSQPRSFWPALLPWNWKE